MKGSLPTKRPSLGITLIELMVVLAVLVILAAVGIPAFQRLAAESRVSSQANATQSAVQFARSEALKRRSSIVLCRDGQNLVVAEGATCDAAEGNLLVVPVDPRVALSGVNGGLTFLPTGYIASSRDFEVADSSGGGAVARRVEIRASGFSEITRVSG